MLGHRQATQAALLDDNSDMVAPPSLTTQTPTVPPVVSAPPAVPADRAPITTPSGDRYVAPPSTEPAAAHPTRHWATREIATETVALRIEHLLRRKYDPCGASAAEPANCLGTVLWVIGADTHDSPQAYGVYEPGQRGAFADRLMANGYQPVSSHQVIKETKAQYADLSNHPLYTPIVPIREAEAVVDTSGLQLQSGDVLLFARETPDHPGHAAIYVGTVRGEPMVFQKDSMHCGFESPYRLVPLQKLVEDEAQLYRRQASDTWNSVHIYRPLRP